MTFCLTARNPNQAFPYTLEMLKHTGVRLPSPRKGDTPADNCIEYPEPVSVTFTHPLERVLSHPQRRINPFLHYFEPFWILAGCRDVNFLAKMVDKFRNFSDDGIYFAAAYGYRLRNSTVGGEWSGAVDQIRGAIDRLKKNPDDRRTVLMIRTAEEMWYNGKDAACNIAATLKIRNGALNIHVFNRSNDAIWGGPAGGTNHPQFTTLLEYIAGHVGCAVGQYTVTTDSMHVYDNEQWRTLCDTATPSDPYLFGRPDHEPVPMMGEPELFDRDLYYFFGHPSFVLNRYIANQLSVDDFKSKYFREVFFPMWRTFISYRDKDGMEHTHLEHIGAGDWQNAVVDFFNGIPRLQRSPT